MKIKMHGQLNISRPKTRSIFIIKGHLEDPEFAGSTYPPVAMNSLESYFSTSFIGDLSYQPPTTEVAGLAHTMVTGRKTWKTFKSKNNEAVWPIHIEAALFDGKFLSLSNLNLFLNPLPLPLFPS